MIFLIVYFFIICCFFSINLPLKNNCTLRSNLVENYYGSHFSIHIFFQEDTVVVSGEGGVVKFYSLDKYEEIYSLETKTIR